MNPIRLLFLRRHAVLLECSKEDGFAMSLRDLAIIGKYGNGW